MDEKEKWPQAVLWKITIMNTAEFSSDSTI